MFEFLLHPVDLLAWDYLWQSTLFLGLGLVASVILARRPARAHRFLLLAMLAALVSPIVTQAVRRTGWGLLTPDTDHANSARVGASPIAAPPSVRTLLSSAAAASLPARQPVSPVTIARSHVVDLPDSVGRPVESAGQPHAGLVPIAWRTFLVGVWAALAVLAGLRLVIGLILGMIVIHRARLVKNETLEATAVLAAARLGVKETPKLRVSPQVRCPAIWCWTRRPVIVLPEDAETAAAPVDWAGIFCHELAHWLRRDQWSGLLAELLTCALPWHPLAWGARRRLAQLSELACDDWVLAAGLPAADYADSLLSLIPQRRGLLAMSAISSQRALPRRIRHILGERHSSPMVGSYWAWVSAVAMTLVSSAVALAQSRPPVKNQSSQLQGDARYSGPSKVSAATPNARTTRRSISGTVLGPDGRPVSGAAVVWIGHRKPPLPHRALPEDQKARPAIRTDVVGETRTDTSGRFSLAAEFDPDRYEHDDGSDVHLLVRASGLGVLSRFVKAGVTEATLRMAPEVVIRGRLLTPGGMPASGVRVTLDEFYNAERTEGMAVGMTPTDDLVPRYWPIPRTTDTAGRFTLGGMSQGNYVCLNFWHSDYAVDEVTVYTARPSGIAVVVKAYLDGLETHPAMPVFRHTLKPARPFQGRVTDKVTGKPLPNVLVQLSAIQPQSAPLFFGRTDVNGRYRMSGRHEESYGILVLPASDSAYLGARYIQRAWPAGATHIEKDFALEKGWRIRGRVIDGETKRPIKGATVGYQPRSENPNRANELHFSNTTSSDGEGEFAITTLPGRGVVSAYIDHDRYMRLSDGRQIPPQGSAPIDVTRAGKPKPVEIVVRKGAVLRAKLVGPDGASVPKVTAWCDGLAPLVMMDAWEPTGRGLFRLNGADRGTVYRVFFIQSDRQLGAVVDLMPDLESKPAAEITLQPTGKVHGRVVYEDGSPAESAQAQPILVLERPKVGTTGNSENENDTTFYAELMSQKAIASYWMKGLGPKPDGKFVIDTLVPGVRLMVAAGVGRQEVRVPVPPLKPGEDRDLGTITLKERPR